MIAALDTLPDAQREVIVLYFYQSLSQQAIADALAIPLGTVKSRLFNGVKRLRERMEALDMSSMMSPNGKHPEETPGNVGFDEAEQVGAFLHRWRDPAPDPAAKAALINLLAAEMETIRQALTPARSPTQVRRGERSALHFDAEGRRRIGWRGRG